MIDQEILASTRAYLDCNAAIWYILDAGKKHREALLVHEAARKHKLSNKAEWGGAILRMGRLMVKLRTTGELPSRTKMDPMVEQEMIHYHERRGRKASWDSRAIIIQRLAHQAETHLQRMEDYYDELERYEARRSRERDYRRRSRSRGEHRGEKSSSRDEEKPSVLKKLFTKGYIF
jgi:hypothetical protein